MRAQNLTLLTDLYELTMMQGYYENPSDQIVVFDAFYRKNPCGGAYAVCAGLEQVIEYVRDLHFSPDDIDYLRSLHIFNDDFLEYLRGFHFTGDIYAIPEGTVVFPREPLLKVVAPIMEAQLVETAILNMINHQSLIATKASRVVYAAKGDGIMEFGLRRAQGPDAGIYGARAAMIGGCIGTSNVLTGQMFDVPVKGTHAHSWIMSFPDEYTAFKTYAKMYPEACILLVDTYDVLESGVPNAIRVFKEMRAEGISAVTTDFQPDEETGFPAVKDGEKEIVGGIITDKKIKYTKNNKTMAFLTLDNPRRQYGNRRIPARLREKRSDDADRCACLHPGPCFRGG